MPYILNISSDELIKVPDAEYKVLTVLAALNKEAHGPAISRASNGSISVAAIYKLLSRLEKRGLVQKREEYVEVGDIAAKRVLYKLCETVNLAHREKTSDANKAESARRAHNSPVQEVGSGKEPLLAFSSRTTFA